LFGNVNGWDLVEGEVEVPAAIFEAGTPGWNRRCNLQNASAKVWYKDV